MHSRIVSTTALDVNEGASAMFHLHLARNPGATPVTATPPTRTFTSANWNIDQPVTMTAAEDADLSDDGATVTLTSRGMTTQSVVVTAIDNDVTATTPKMHIAFPLNGQIVTGAKEEFCGHTTDDSGTTTEAQFFIDGVLCYTDPNVVGHYHFGGGHADCDTRGLSNGPYVLQMRVSDGTNVGIHEITVVVSNPTSGAGGGGGGLSGMEPLALLAALWMGRRRRPARR